MRKKKTDSIYEIVLACGQYWFILKSNVGISRKFHWGNIIKKTSKLILEVFGTT